MENQDKYVFSWTGQAVLTLINEKDGATLNVNIYNLHLQFQVYETGSRCLNQFKSVKPVTVFSLMRATTHTPRVAETHLKTTNEEM